MLFSRKFLGIYVFLYLVIDDIAMSKFDGTNVGEIWFTFKSNWYTLADPFVIFFFVNLEAAGSNNFDFLNSDGYFAQTSVACGTLN